CRSCRSRRGRDCSRSFRSFPFFVLPDPTRQNRRELRQQGHPVVRFRSFLEATFMPDQALTLSPSLLDGAAAAELVASYPAVSPLAQAKDIGRIDVHLARYIALSPICFVATADKTGRQDVTPRGDPPGSFKVLDEKTIAFADRPGNNRLDTLKNILENPEI